MILQAPHRLAVALALILFATATSRGIEITGLSLPGNTTLKILTGSVSYGPVTVRGTDAEPNGIPVTYPYIVYVTGEDIYENIIYIPVAAGAVTVTGQHVVAGNPPTIVPPTTDSIPAGTWFVPNDGTLHNIVGGYRMIVAFFNLPAVPPALGFRYPQTLAELQGAFLPRESGELKVDVLPNLAVDVPAVTYPAAGYTYQSGDTIRFTSIWFNNIRGEGDRQSRPLKVDRDSVEESADGYVADLRLSSNNVFGDANNDDFLISRLRFRGDVQAIPDGASILRRVDVTGTPTTVPGYGIPDYTAGGAGPLILGTARLYVPQPDDSFLDLGETVSATTEGTIPANFAGEYFVALQVRMSNPNNDANPNNNTFVSNAANKISVVEDQDATTEAMSVVSTEIGTFVQGGNAVSDYSSVSENGAMVAFVSRASNLLIPPDQGNVSPGVFATTGQQVFLKFRDSRQVVLASRNQTGTQANADCFNAAISADGRFVAYDSRASNLVTQQVSRPSIFVYDTENFTTRLVSVNARGELANGDSFRPRVSQSGRFVVFESLARNLDVNNPVPANAPSRSRIYLHDRDADEDGIFDEPGGIATYLVSVTRDNQLPNAACMRPVVNLDDTPEQIEANGGIYVAYTSDASNIVQGTGGRLVYRMTLAPDPQTGVFGPRPESVELVSQNELGQAPAALQSVDPVNSPIVALADEAAINGDGSQVAFMSTGVNLVRNENFPNAFIFTPTYPNNAPADATAPVVPGLLPGGDYNRVPDIFVRNFNKALLPGEGAVVRVSVSEPRAATGTISFVSRPYLPTPWPGNPANNVPAYQPADGDTLSISDGFTTQLFVFRTVANPAAVNPIEVQIGPVNIQETRSNLARAINTSPLLMRAEITNPSNDPVSIRTGAPNPGTAYVPSIYLRNLVRGRLGNLPIVFTAPVPSTAGEIVVRGMSGGGTQGDDDALRPGLAGIAPIQGVPFGSGQPSIDRVGRFVAYRTIATNLDVFEQPDRAVYPGDPQAGELIRPLVFPTSNVYVRDRNLFDTVNPTTGIPVFDVDTATTRVSVNRFGYKTLIDGGQVSGRGAETSANSNLPALSPDGRFVSFSSDASGEGGLIFGPNNLTPLDSQQIKDVFLHDRRTVGEDPPVPALRPEVAILTPENGLVVAPGSAVAITATASPAPGKAIQSVELFVNGVSEGRLDATPFSWSYTPKTAGTYIFNVVATDTRSVTGNASIQITAVQPIVPVNPPVGSPQRFVLDYFRKVFLRQPTYAEYDYYLGLLEAGQSQAGVIMEMMTSPTYNAAENVLFGYYLRMGVAPLSTNEVSNLLSLMTSPSPLATNGTTVVTATNLLPTNMTATSATNLQALSPYGATYGQAAAADQLIKRVTNPWNGEIVATTSSSTNFVNWMFRTFNAPYLPAAGPVNGTAQINASTGQVTNIPVPAQVATNTFYYSPPVVTVTAPPVGSTSRTAIAQAVVSNGVVTRINLTDPGAGYTNAPSVTILPVLSQGNQTSLINTLNSFQPQTSKLGATYAFFSAFNAVATPTDTNLRTMLSSFDPLARGVAATYLLSPSNTWSANSAPLSTNLVTQLLPPAITGVASGSTVTSTPGTNTVRVGVAFSNQIVGQNFLTNTTFRAINPTNASAPALPAGVTLNTNTGVISGTPASTQTGVNVLYPVILVASRPGPDGVTLSGTNTFTYRVQPATPIITSPNEAAGVVGNAFNFFITATNFPRTFAITGTLPDGLLFNFATGQIIGTPTQAGTNVLTVSAINAGGTGSGQLTIGIAPVAGLQVSAFRAWLTEHGIDLGAARDACTDGDGACYNTEYAFGMDPNEPDRTPWIVQRDPVQISLLWTGRIDETVTYEVQAAHSLSGAWAAPLNATAPETFTGPYPPRDGYRWLRVRIPSVDYGDNAFFRVRALIDHEAVGVAAP